MAQDKVVTWDELVVGTDQNTERFPFTVTDEHIGRWMDCIGDRNPIYYDDAAGKAAGLGGKIVPPSMAFIVTQTAGRHAAARPPGGVHAKQSFEYFEPVHPGDVLITSTKIVEKYVKNERKYIVTEAVVTNQKGQKVLVGRSTSIVAR